MPRYFFDIWDGDNRIPDDEGTERADLDAALREAHASAVDLIKQYADSDYLAVTGCHIAIHDEGGNVVARIPITLSKPH